jgi:hypothetical protein
MGAGGGTVPISQRDARNSSLQRMVERHLIDITSLGRAVSNAELTARIIGIRSSMRLLPALGTTTIIDIPSSHC